jgi:hypothetical protein
MIRPFSTTPPPPRSFFRREVEKSGAGVGLSTGEARRSTVRGVSASVVVVTV